MGMLLKGTPSLARSKEKTWGYVYRHVVEGSWLSCKGKGSAWALGGKQADVKTLVGISASPHMRTGLAEVADGTPKLISPGAIGVLETRKIRGFF